MEDKESTDSNCTVNLRVEQRNTTTNYIILMVLPSPLRPNWLVDILSYAADCL